MIASNYLIPNSLKNYQIDQIYFSPSAMLNDVPLSSLYAFLSFQNTWNQTVLTSTVANTTITANTAVIENSNTVVILDKIPLSDFFVDQYVISPYFPSTTQIISIDSANSSLGLNNVSNTSFIDTVVYNGLNQVNLITIDESNTTASLSINDGFYNNCAIDIIVDSNLSYTMTVTDYNANLKTLTVDSVFNGGSPITNSSILKLYYDETHPPAPLDTIRYIKNVYRNIYYIKKLTSNDLSPVVERIDWNLGYVYDQFSDSVNMFEKDLYGKLIKHFYVKTSGQHVFKCLWNNNGGASTEEPNITNTTNGIFDASTDLFYSYTDGYKWKYLYTISLDKYQKFMNADYIPVDIGGTNTINGNIDILNSSEGGGGIEAIGISANGWHTSNVIEQVIITGDGSDASAYVVYENPDITVSSKIIDLVITNFGKDYTYATVEVPGTNTIATPIISPPGGFGQNLLNDLGCDKIMVSSLFTQDADPDLPIDMQIRQFGLLHNPQDVSSSPYPANNSNYVCGSIGIVSPGINNYQRGEMVYQYDVLSNTTFYTATVVNFDPTLNRLLLVNETGLPTTSYNLYGSSSGAIRSLLDLQQSNLIKYSGNVIYVQNTEEIQRGNNSIELFKVVLKY